MSLQLLYLPVYKLTFYILKIDKKNALDLQYYTIVYLKENSRIEGKFFKKILTQKIKKTYFLALK